MNTTTKTEKATTEETTMTNAKMSTGTIRKVGVAAPATADEIARITSMQPSQSWGCSGRMSGVKCRRFADGSYGVTVAWLVEEGHDDDPGSYMSIFPKMQGRAHEGWTAFADGLEDAISLYASLRSLPRVDLQTPPSVRRIEAYVAR